MSVAINLLPDVRLARIRSQHIRHMVTGIAVAIWIVAAIVIGLLFGGIGAQTLVLSNVNNQIKSDISSINNVPNLSSALSAQNALQTLPGLYHSRTYYSKYLPLIVAAMPSTLFVSSVSNSSGSTTGSGVVISGTANSAYAVDQFYEALKASGVGTTNGANFSVVTINDVSRTSEASNVSFTVTATLSPGAISG